MYLFLFLILSFILSIVFTLIVKRIAFRYNILDYPNSDSRKIHKKPTPLLGGTAVFLSFILTIFFSYLFGYLPSKNIQLKNLIGLSISGLILVIGGFLDDCFHLKPKQQIIWPILASLVVIGSGLGINYINNPFSQGYIHFDSLKIEVFRFHGLPYYFTPWADIFTFIWLLVLSYSTKLLDGLDGLVSGMGIIACLVIFGLCLFTQFYQPDVGLLALIFAGSLAGFLIFNFHPAKIFLGEGGSLMVGFYLGCLSLISGSKVAISFLVLGVAILDVIWVILYRIFKEHKSPFLAGQEHFHFRLLKLGFSHKGAVFFLWIISALWGGIALFFRTKVKLILIVLLISLVLLFDFLMEFCFLKNRRKEGKMS